MTRAGARSGPDDGGVYTQPLGDGDAGLPQGFANRQPPTANRQPSPGSRSGATGMLSSAGRCSEECPRRPIGLILVPAGR
jgi:hypothetical protein